MSRDYVLITPARNEAAFIEHPLRAVTAQQEPPKRWVVVSDGSTDATDDLVREYAQRYPFIQLLRREPEREHRSFASKVYAIRAGMEAVADVDHAYLGILDADISFAPDYYAQVLNRFEQDPEVAIAGGVLFEPENGEWVQQFMHADWSVSGPIQMFRREAWEQIGGYLPLQYASEDGTAETMVRMHGWRVQAYEDLRVHHHRPTGTEKTHIFTAKFRQGKMDYYSGNHVLFQLSRAGLRLRHRPWIIGGALMFLGYSWTWLRGEKPEIPPEVTRYLRWEQARRLKGRLVGKHYSGRVPR